MQRTSEPMADVPTPPTIDVVVLAVADGRPRPAALRYRRAETVRVYADPPVVVQRYDRQRGRLPHGPRGAPSSRVTTAATAKDTSDALIQVAGVNETAEATSPQKDAHQLTLPGLTSW